MYQNSEPDVRWIENLFEQKLRDPDGILRAMLKLDTLTPWKPEDTGENDLHAVIPGYETMPLADYLNYENTGMVQGTYLSALTFKYRVTGDEAVRELAKLTFRGIVKVYEMSQSIAPGFYCKPWGGHVTDETSSDQYIYTMYGMDDYYPLADQNEQEQIRTMMTAMVRFWLDHGYDWNYYGVMLHWRQVRFISFMALALKYGGGPEFETELKRLTELQETSTATPFGSTPAENTWKEPGKPVRLNIGPEASLSTFLSFEAAMERNNRPRFMEICRESMKLGRMGLAGDGTTYPKLLQDPESGEFREMDPARSTFTRTQFQSPIYGLNAPFRKGGMQSTMFARFVLAFEKFDPQCGGRKLAEDLLRQVGTKHLTWFEDPYGIFPPEMRWMTNVFSGDAAAHWLWVYWKLRLLEKS